MFENLSHPDIVSWNTVLSGFEESVDALNFARSMHFRGIAFDLDMSIFEVLSLTSLFTNQISRETEKSQTVENRQGNKVSY